MILSFSQRFKELRKAKNLSQETVAERLGITSQAVSKWECSLSYPDIELLPAIADMLGVSIDSLFRDDLTADKEGKALPFPNDNRTRLIRFCGHNIIQHIPYNKDTIIYEDDDSDASVIEIWGNCVIEGDVHRKLACADNVECNDIVGDVATGGNVECNDICGSVVAGGDVECNSVYGNACSKETSLSDVKDCVQYNFDTEWAEQLRSQVTSSVKEAMSKVFGKIE